MPNQNIFDRIIDGDETVLDDMYRTYRAPFLTWVQKQYDCSEDLAIEFYQTVILIFYHDIESGKRKEPSVAILTQLYEIAIDRWQNFNQCFQSRNYSKDLDLLNIILTMEGEMQKHKIRSLYQALLKLGDPHRKTLEITYANQLYHIRFKDQPDQKLTEDVKYDSIQRLIRILGQD